jgi:CRISPR-associated endonuclease/helicase Cas3
LQYVGKITSVDKVFAHSVEGRSPADWEPLADHLNRVSALSAEFCEAFQSGQWGRLAGLWHDLGKYDPRF